MTMTPQDIQAQQFNVRFRGFDMAEVDAFLEELAGNLFQLLQENNQLRDQVQLLEKYHQDSISKEDNFKDAIIAAQKVADEMRQRSSREADELLNQAREEGADIRRDLEREQAGLQEEITNLQGLRDTIRQELRAVLRSYLDQLDNVLVPVPTAAEQKSASTPNRSPQSDGRFDLYQKIDLPDSAFGGIIRGCSGKTADNKDTEVAPGRDGQEPEEPTAPASESDGPEVSDVLFSLDETAPSEPEPAVTFDDEATPDSKKRSASR